MIQPAETKGFFHDEEENPGPYPLGHFAALRLATEIGATERRMWWPKTTMISPEKLMALLRREKIGFVLLGAYAIAGWRDQPRATQDIDLLVRKRNQKKTTRVIHARYPKLGLKESPGMTRFIDPANEKSVVELFFPDETITEEFFANTIYVDQSYRIPNLELALLTKFRSMKARERDLSKKYLDAGDFLNMALNNFDSIDFDRLKKLGDTILSAGSKLVRLVKNIQSDPIHQLIRYF